MKPPSLARWFLNRTLTGAARSAIIGDLDEEFTTSVLPRFGARRARGWYYRQAIRSVIDHRLGRPVGWRDRAQSPAVRLRDAIRQEREMVMSDLRHAARMLVRQPGFTAIVVLTLALGFGANIAVFSGANAWLFKPLPVPTRDRLFSLRYQGGGADFPYHVYLTLREHATAFDHLAAYARMPLTLRDEGEMDRVVGELVSGNYFATLGITAARGRALSTGDDRPGAAGAIVLSDRLWKRRFHADPSIIGKAIRLNGFPCTVVGIAPASFYGLRVGQSPDLWIPLQLEAAFSPNRSALKTRTIWWLNVVGTLRAGATRAAATTATTHALRTEQPDRRILLEPADRNARQGLLPTPIILLQGLALSTLLICCVNVTSLLLARSTVRQRELALRASLGAGRVRLVRQVLVESGLLVAVGCLVGMVAAAPIASAAIRLMPGRQPTVPRCFTRPPRASLRVAVGADSRAWRQPCASAARRARHSAALSQEHTPISDAATWRCWWLQVAAAPHADCAQRSASRRGWAPRAIASTPPQPGAPVEPDRVLVADVSPADAGHEGEQLRQFYTELRSRLASLPSVVSVGLGERSPLEGTIDVGGAPLIEGMPPLEAPPQVHGNRVTPGFFEATGMSVVAGRDFVDADRAGARLVVAVNQAFVRRFLPGTNPLGRRIRGKGGPALEIIGVVRDFRFASLHEKPPPAVFHSVAQQSSPPPRLTVHLRAVGDARMLIGALRDQVRLLDPDVGLTDIRTLAMQFDRRLGEERLVTTVAALFGGLALLLAAIGLYGVVSYAVARRTAEMGIRVALGATPAGIRHLVLRETLVVVLLGLALGVPLAWAGARFARSLLYGVAAGDVVVFAITLITLLGTAILAAWLPAHRASRVDPVTALRAE